MTNVHVMSTTLFGKHHQSDSRSCYKMKHCGSKILLLAMDSVTLTIAIMAIIYSESLQAAPVLLMLSSIVSLSSPWVKKRLFSFVVLLAKICLFIFLLAEFRNTSLCIDGVCSTDYLSIAINVILCTLNLVSCLAQCLSLRDIVQSNDSPT